MAMKAIGRNLCSILLLTGCIFLTCGIGHAATTLKLTFITTTAPHAALGAPMGYSIGLTNSATKGTSVNVTLTLKAPDLTTFTLLTTQSTIGAGGNTSIPGTFTTSQFTSQTGAFTLTATITNRQGVTLLTGSLPLTVLTVPANGIYASVGGQGPDTAVMGTTWDFSTVTANLSTTTLSLLTKTTLIKTDSTEIG